MAKGWTVERTLDGGQTWERDSWPCPKKTSQKGLTYRRYMLRQEYPGIDAGQIKLRQIRSNYA